MSAEYSVDWLSPSERNPNRTMRGEFCSLLSDLQREWMKDGAEDGSAAIDAAYEALHQFVSRLSTHPHSPYAADSGRVTKEMVDALRKIAAIQWQYAATNGCAYEAAKIAKAALEAALAAQGRGDGFTFQERIAFEVGADEDDQDDIIRHVIAWVKAGKDAQYTAPPASPAGVPDAVAEVIRECWKVAHLFHSGDGMLTHVKHALDDAYAAPSATPEGGEVK